MKLFYSPGSCSLAPMIIAEWLGIKLTLQKLDLNNGDYKNQQVHNALIKESA